MAYTTYSGLHEKPDCRTFRNMGVSSATHIARKEGSSLRCCHYACTAESAQLSANYAVHPRLCRTYDAEAAEVTDMTHLVLPR